MLALDKLVAGQTMVLVLLACWLDKELAARQMAVLPCGVNEGSAVGRRVVLAHRRDVDLTACRTVDARSLAQLQVGVEADGGARSPAQR